MSGSRPVLTQGPDGRCIFWDKLCTIHPVKPRMCREWPFIPAILTDVQNWRTMADSCPGIRADAPEAAILRIVREKLAESRGPA
jgi:Fe-S-cluster containining protein